MSATSRSAQTPQAATTPTIILSDPRDEGPYDRHADDYLHCQLRPLPLLSWELISYNHLVGLALEFTSLLDVYPRTLCLVPVDPVADPSVGVCGGGGLRQHRLILPDPIPPNR